MNENDCSPTLLNNVYWNLHLHLSSTQNLFLNATLVHYMNGEDYMFLIVFQSSLVGGQAFFWLHCTLWKVDLSNLARYAFNQRLEDTKDVTLSCLLVYAINQKGRNPVMPHCENGIWKSTLIMSVLSF